MKRLLAFLFVSAIFFILPSAQSQEIFASENIYKMTIVTKEDLNIDKIQNENQFYYSTNSNFAKFAQKFKQVDGINLYFKNCCIDEITKTLKITCFKGQNLDESEMYYGYTNLYKESYYLDNKKVNVQIAVKDDQIIVGFPAILTGF